jgi:hypothetical protein
MCIDFRWDSLIQNWISQKGLYLPHRESSIRKIPPTGHPNLLANLVELRYPLMISGGGVILY